MKRRPFLQTLALASAWAASGAYAQPAGRTVRIITALPAGSAIDIQVRTLAPFLSASLGQPVIVENKPGGRDIIAATEVLKSPADGTTLFMGSQSPLALNVALVKNLPYDPRKDLTPISGVSLVNHILVVKSTFPAKTFQELLAYAKQHPGKVSMGYGTTLVQMQIASVSKGAGVELLAVPYKGTPAQVTDLLGDILTATFLDPGNALPHIKSGAMRALAVSSLKRNPLTPDIPAVSETLPGFDFAAWTAMVGPANMRPETVDKIHAAMDAALKQKEVVDKFAQAATNPLLLTPEQLKSLIDTETSKWLRLAREANIQPE
ncbi:MAG: tripartite tricarboxylate transporter substrate binding protein [Polaromonas sp.]|nr:tripartite tricarboxylate transporter substrate binding protein [Polaromonas sp.]